MKISFFAAVGGCVAILSGCATPYSEAPLATNFPATKQQKLQAAAHWNVIAGDVAKQISSGLVGKPSLYVNQPSSANTTFDRAFSNQLISALIAEGFTIQKIPTGALLVDVDTQSMHFSANRPQYKYAGMPTALVAGVWALHAAEATAGAILSAGAVSADAYSWFQSEFSTGATPQTEIIVTVSVSDSSKYWARNTNIYYVADADSRMYEPPPPPRVVQTKNIGVVGQ
jgi:hypothetical protein